MSATASATPTTTATSTPTTTATSTPTTTATSTPTFFPNQGVAPFYKYSNAINISTPDIQEVIFNNFSNLPFVTPLYTCVDISSLSITYNSVSQGYVVIEIRNESGKTVFLSSPFQLISDNKGSVMSLSQPVTNFGLTNFEKCKFYLHLISYNGVNFLREVTLKVNIAYSGTPTATPTATASATPTATASATPTATSNVASQYTSSENLCYSSRITSAVPLATAAVTPTATAAVTPTATAAVTPTATTGVTPTTTTGVTPTATTRVTPTATTRVTPTATTGVTPTATTGVTPTATATATATATTQTDNILVTLTDTISGTVMDIFNNLVRKINITTTLANQPKPTTPSPIITAAAVVPKTTIKAVVTTAPVSTGLSASQIGLIVCGSIIGLFAVLFILMGKRNIRTPSRI